MTALHLRPYLRLALAGFRRQSAYLAAAGGGLVANITFGFLKAAVLLAGVRAAGGDLQGYDAGTMLAYVWVGQGVLGLFNVHGRDVLGERIRSGDVVVDFLRPLHLQAAGLATYLGERLFSLLPRGVPTVTVGALTTGLAMPAMPTPYLLGTVSLLLGMALSYLAVFCLNITGLWLVEVRGLQVAYMVVCGFLCGLYVPVAIFPDWLELLARLTPFPAMMMTPIDILIGRVRGTEALLLVAVQVGWLAVVGGLGAWLTRSGRRTLEVQGG